MTTAPSEAATGVFVHPALFYDRAETYTSGIVSFLETGLAMGEPALVAVPGHHLELIRDGLGGSADSVVFADMTDLGRNPSRIIPAIRRFTDASPGRTRFVGEPIWAGRTPAEIREATRHEALINAAFTGVETTILCPYDTANLDAAVLEEARRTHPHVQEDAGLRPSPAYDASALAQAIVEERSPAPPADADVLRFGQQDLSALRRLVRRHAAQAGLDADRTRYLLLAVNEVATNTVTHAKAPGTLRIWRDGEMLVCEVSDSGRITDPLAGRRLLPPEASAGHGLWMVNQVCDLVEMRSGRWGTAVRMYMRCR